MITSVQNLQPHVNYVSTITQGNQLHDNSAKVPRCTEALLFHQNVQCLSNCKHNLDIVLEEINNPDIVVLSEHWQTEDSIRAYNLQNYKLITSFCRSKTTSHGGVAIYASMKNKSLISSARVRREINCFIEEFIFECSCAEFTIKGELFVIVAIYKPPKTNLDIYMRKLENIIELLTSSSKNKQIIITGDINVDMLDKQNKEKITNLLNCYNMCALIKDPTRVTSKSATCLDNIYVYKDSNFQGKVINAHISDHLGQ